MSDQDQQQPLSPDEQQEMYIVCRPWLFAESYLQNPHKPDRPLKLRSYQKKILKDRHYRKLLRMGRRTGKTVSLGIEAIYEAFTSANQEILIITAYESQLNVVFESIKNMCFDSPYIKDSIVRATRKPQMIEFSNGSVIKGNLGNSSARSLCVSDDTYVWMADATWKRISDIEVGDRVLSWNWQKDRYEIKPVTAKHDNGIKPVTLLSTSSGRLLEGTEEHDVFTSQGNEIRIHDIQSELSSKGKGDYITAIGIQTTWHPLLLRPVTDLSKRFTRVRDKQTNHREAQTWDIAVADNNNYIALYPPDEEVSPFRRFGVSNGGLLVHNSADKLIIDECDYIPPDTMEADVWPIAFTRRGTEVILSSTPSGRRNFFWKISSNATDTAFDFHEFHVPSWDSPEWTPEAERLARKTTDDSTFDREYGAEFGESLEGVFKNLLINEALFVYRYDKISPSPDGFITMGVDWNEDLAGVRVKILEHVKSPTTLQPYNDGRPQDVQPVSAYNFIRILDAVTISAKEKTNTVAIDTILDLLKRYPIDFASFDKGHGHTNYEMLRLSILRGISPTGKSCKGLKHYLGKMMVVDYGEKMEIEDVATGDKTMVMTKNFIVKNTVSLLEKHRLVIPAVDKKGNSVELEKHRLIGQMRDYAVKNITRWGEVYTKGNDHDLDAYMLALYSFSRVHDVFLPSSKQDQVIQAAISRNNRRRPVVRDPEAQRSSVSGQPKSVSYKNGIKFNSWGNQPGGDPEFSGSNKQRQRLKRKSGQSLRHRSRRLPSG